MLSRALRWGWVLGLFPLLILGGCSEQPTVPQLQPVSTALPEASVLRSPEARELPWLPRALAVVLSDDTLRQQMLEDMRDSPFPDHSLHLNSYLAGRRGEALVAAIERALGWSRASVLADLAGAGAWSFKMPRPLDRINWDGSDRLLVMDIRDVPQALKSGIAAGYAPGGSVVSFSMTAMPSLSFLVLSPAGSEFGTDPEGQRARAPKMGRTTVSTPQEEFRLGGFSTLEECTPEMETCEDPPGGTPPNSGIDLGAQYTWANCYVAGGSGGDVDGDYYLDSCEAALADAFRPLLHLQWLDVDVSRESYWAAAPISTSLYQVRLFFALGYHRDTGFSTGHYGDSEFVIVDVQLMGGKWNLAQMYLSAHWGYWFSSSSWYPYSEVFFDTIERGRPNVWVALDKHANYESRAHCDSGQYLSDDCSGNYYTEVADAPGNANLGRQGHYLVNCAPSRVNPILFPGTECFWGYDDFKGWYNVSSGAGTYRNSLTSYMPS